MISVALCTYNGAKYLGEQLESILNQTRSVNEIVICDDRSTDATADIVKAFQDKAPFPIYFYRNDSQLGSTKNFEKCLQLCQGDIIFLCDQDDSWMPEKVEKLVDYLEKNISEIKPRTNELLQIAARLNKNDQQWLGNIMLEIATRFNDSTLASQSIPLLNVDNLPNALAKSNWYISQQEYSNAIKILTQYRYHDGALYRIILSKQKLNDPLAEKDLNELTQRVQNLLDHKDHIHLREQAQFLWVSKKYDEGLRIAAKNWNMQRENDDFEIYAALALDSKNRESTEKLLNWSNETGYQNPTYIQKLKQMLKQL